MHALDVTGDRVRRRILELLSGGAMSAGAVVEQLQVEFGISQPAVSQHLTLLRETGFVGVEAAGRRRLYRLLPERFEQIGDWLEQFAAVNNSARSAPTRPAQPGTAPTRPAPTQVLFGPRALGALEALETEVARGKLRRQDEEAAAMKKSRDYESRDNKSRDAAADDAAAGDAAELA